MSGPEHEPTAAGDAHWPAVSVVMPVLDEQDHLASSVEGVLRQSYPGEVEIVLAIGPCHDRTPEIAAELAARHGHIMIVDNPSGATPQALNLAIAAASHDIIVRVDAHGELAEGYIRRAVELLRQTGAANVGGLMAAKGRTPFEEAVAVAYTSRVGLGGGAFHLASSPAGPADTVFLGVFRRDALDKVGGFDPSLKRAQDWELNYRLRKAGELVWFSPELQVTYRPRSSVRALAKQFFRTGQWRREVMRRNPDTISARYLAPPVTVTALAVGVAGSLVAAAGGPRVLRHGAALPLAYLASLAAVSAGMRREMSAGARLRLPMVLATMHMSWGAGAVVGLPRAERETAEEPLP